MASERRWSSCRVAAAEARERKSSPGATPSARTRPKRSRRPEVSRAPRIERAGLAIGNYDRRRVNTWPAGCLPAPKEKQERGTESQREPEQQLEEVRLLHVDLQKKDLGGLVLWWKSAFKGDAEIDTNALADRTKKRATQSATFMDNFKKAQQMFVERVRNKEGPQPVELDFGDDDDDDNDDSDSGGGCGDKEE